MRNVAFLLPFFVAAAACSSTASDDLTASEDAVKLGAAPICSTLDYGHDRTPADYYRFFADDAATAQYVRAIAQQGQLASVSGPGAELREIIRDGHIDRLVAEVFTGFKRAFPRETAGLETAPPVAIVKSDIVNAFALGAGFVEDAAAPADRAPWLFIVHTAALEQDVTDDELRGLFAHELGHLILRTFTPEIQRRVRTIYEVKAGSEDGVFGAVQEDDPRIAAHVEKIMERQSRLGGIVTLGMPVALPGAYIKGLLAMIDAAPQTDACKAAKQDRTDLVAAQIPFLPNQDEALFVPTEPTAQERAELDRLSDKLASDAAACLVPVGQTGDFTELAAMLKLPVLPIEAQLDVEMPNGLVVTKLLRAEKLLRQELIALRADPEFPIDRLRVFDYEEDADDASVRVLSAIGAPPASLGDFLLSALMPAEKKAKCKANVAAGVPIPYGQLVDPHQASCWRYYHVNQLASALSQCPATSKSLEATPASRTRNLAPSALDKSAIDIVKEGYQRHPIH